MGNKMATNMDVRRASHAGSWYTKSSKQLDGELQSWLNEASVVHAPAKAIIAPHAGYSYSGPCAGHAYKQIDPSRVRRVFILGPSHHAYLPLCALSLMTTYETPLYNLDIDKEIYRELESTGQFEKMTHEVDEREHSIEMHLPYIAKVMESQKGKFTIVPVLVGALREDKEASYGKLFSKYLTDPENLFIISSDFCHWGDRFRYKHYDKTKGPIHASIHHLDHQGMKKIETLNAKGFAEYLGETNNTICGRHPIAVLLHAIEVLKSASGFSFQMKFVQYAQSNQCRSPSDSSVSYASASLVASSPSPSS